MFTHIKYILNFLLVYFHTAYIRFIIIRDIIDR